MCGITEGTWKVSLELYSFQQELKSTCIYNLLLLNLFCKKDASLHKVTQSSRKQFFNTGHTEPYLFVNGTPHKHSFLYQILKYLAISVGVPCSAKCAVGEWRQIKGERGTPWARMTQDSSVAKSWHQQRRTSQWKIVRKFKMCQLEKKKKKRQGREGTAHDSSSSP